jgi:hypothetical protein
MKRLPSHVQKQADRAFEHFAIDPRYPSLHFKCVNKVEAKYSMRIGRTYRTLGHVQGDEIT